MDLRVNHVRNSSAWGSLTVIFCSGTSWVSGTVALAGANGTRGNMVGTSCIRELSGTSNCCKYSSVSCRTSQVKNSWSVFLPGVTIQAGTSKHTGALPFVEVNNVRLDLRDVDCINAAPLCHRLRGNSRPVKEYTCL